MPSPPPPPRPNQIVIRQRREPCKVYFELTPDDGRIYNFVSRAEYTELINEVNASTWRAHACNPKTHPIALCLLYVSLGHIFCPLFYVACQMTDRVNNDLKKMAIVEQLKQRGILIQYYSGNKYQMGGLLFTLPTNASAGMGPGQVGQPQIGQLVMVQNPDGSTQQMIMG